MKTFTFLKTMLLAAILVVGSGSVWGQINTITINLTSAGGTTNLGTSNYNSGAERVWAQSGISFGGKAITANPVNSPTTGTTAGQFIQAQGNSTNHGVIYNTTAFPGRITSITLTTATGATARDVYCYGGSTSRLVNNTAGNYTVTGGTQVGSASATGWTTTNFSGTNYTYFAIQLAVNSTAYWSKIEITYEEDVPTTVATPTFSPDGGTYYTPQIVTISTETTGADIYYTTDGTDPTESATAIEYQTPITVSTTTTIKAVAVDSEFEFSDVAEATYIFPVPYTVSFDAGSGTYTGGDLPEASAESGITLPSATPPAKCVTAGWTFAGWAEDGEVSETTIEPTLYASGETYYPTSDITLYAVYSNTVGEGGEPEYTLTNTLTNGDYVFGAIIGTATATPTNEIAVANGTIGTWGGYTKTTPTNGVIIPASDSHIWTLAVDGSGFSLKNKSTEKYLVLTSGTSSSSYSESTTASAIYASVVNSTFSTFEMHNSSTSTASSGNQLGCNLTSNMGYRMYVQRTHQTTATGISTQIRFFKATASSVTTYNSSPSCTATGLPSIEISGLYTTAGAIHFNALAGESVEIYNSVGQRVYQGFATDGANSIAVKAGFALVKIGNKASKVIVR